MVDSTPALTPESTREIPEAQNFLEWDPADVQFTYENHGEDTAQVLARMTAEIMNNMPEFQGQMDYEELQMGTAPILSTIDFGPGQQGKGLDDNQILRFFTKMKGLGDDGAPTETDAFLSGLTRGTSSFAAGVAGAKVAAAAAPPYVPLPGPFAPLGTLSKPVSGGVGFFTGAIFGDLLIGSPVSNLLFDGPADVQLTPRAEAKFRAYESAGSVTPYLLMPWTAGKTPLNMVDSLRKLPTGLYRPGKHVVSNRLTPEDMANPLITRYLNGKISGVPTTTAFLQARNRIFRAAADSGAPISLKEAGKRAAAQLNRPNLAVRGTMTGIDFAERALVSGGKMFRDMGPKGKAVVLGTESLAIPATGAAVSAIETAYPRQPGMRALAEVGGSLAPQVTFLRFVPSMLKGMGNYITRRRESIAMGRGPDIFGTQARAENRAINSMFEIFEKNAEDPDALLKAMEELMVEPILKNGKVTGYRLRPEFRKLADQGIDPSTGKPRPSKPIFTSQFTESDSILQLEQLALGRSSNAALSGSRDDSFLKSLEMQRGTIFAFRGSGDPELVRLAGLMMQERLSFLIADRVDRAIQSTISSVRQIYPDGGPEANRLISERLSQVIATQEDLFRRLEKNAWSKIDKNTPVETFYRLDDETGDFVENAVPNFVEEWDALVAATDPLDLPNLMRVPEFKDLNDRVIDIKRQLGLSADNPFAEQLAATTRFNEAYQNTLGLPVRGEYRRLLVNAGLIEDTRPRVDVVREQVNKASSDFFDELIEAPPPRFNPDEPDSLMAKALEYDGMAKELRKVADQDPDSDAMVRMAEEAAEMEGQARLLRARAEDIRNPVTDKMPELEATEENIAALGAIESRLGRQKSRSLDLIRLQRESLIARLAESQGAEATGVVAEPLTQGNLTAVYTSMRRVARREGTVNDNWARIANGMADAALDDLNGRPLGNADYDAARDISYAFNTYLKRAFGGEIMQTNARGKQIVAPQLLTSKLMTGKPDVVALRIEQIQELGNQIRKYAKAENYTLTIDGKTQNVKEEVGASIGTANEVLSDALKLALKEIEIPIETRTTGTALQIAQAQNEAMQQFRQRHAYLFESFPELGRMMDEAGDAGQFLQRARATTKRLDEKARAQKAFQKLTGATNPELAVQKAYSDDDPMKALGSFMELIEAASNPRSRRAYINRAGRDAIDLSEIDVDQAKLGLRHSILGWAFRKGGGHGDQFNASAAYNALYTRIPAAPKDSDTMAKWMVDNGIISEEEANTMQAGLQNIIQTETKKKVSEAVLAGNTSPLSDLYTRITGAKLGSAVGDLIPGGRGAGLVEAEAGSRYLRTLTQELPALQEMDALETILLNPELLALALRKGKTETERMGIIRTLMNRLGEFGIGIAPAAAKRAAPLAAQEIVEPEVSSEFQPAPVAEEPTPDVSVGPVSAAPAQTPTQLFPDLPTTDIASVSPSMNPAGQSSVNRSRFAALFPEDRALIEGIGSLG